MSEILLFDIDATLLDTKKLIDQYIKPSLYTYLSIQPERFLRVNDDYWRTLASPALFDPEEYLLHIASSFDADRVALRHLFYTPEFFEKSVFSDVTETLTKLQSICRLGIYSEGNIEFQTQKLKLAGLIQYLEPDLIFITSSKTSPEFLARLPESTIVDDRLSFIEILAAEPRLRPIWLNREVGVLPLDPPKNTYDTIHSLYEVPALVQGVTSQSEA